MGGRFCPGDNCLDLESTENWQESAIVVAWEFSVLERGSKARAQGDRVKPAYTTGLGS
jgi:hypothetical protein